MSVRPATRYYEEYIQHENRGNIPRLPFNVDCPACNRVGIWKGCSTSINVGETYLLVPCLSCARDSQFYWNGYSTNGVVDHGGTGNQTLELSNHELALTIITEKYNELQTNNEIHPSCEQFNCMDFVLNRIKNNVDIISAERDDLNDYFEWIHRYWQSLGSFPNVQEADDNHEITYLTETFNNTINIPTDRILYIDDETDDETDDEGLNDDDRELNDNDNIYYGHIESMINTIDNLESNYDAYRQEIQSLCREGGNILDISMEDNGLLNEERYRLLINLFYRIYNIEITTD